MKDKTRKDGIRYKMDYIRNRFDEKMDSSMGNAI